MFEQEKGRFLTETQREYLNGQYEPESPNAEDQMNYKIRERIKGAFKDFSVVDKNISNAELSTIFENYKSDINQYPDSLDTENELYQIEAPELITEICSVISIAYRGYLSNEDIDAEKFVNIVLENGLKKGHSHKENTDINYVTAKLNLEELHTDLEQMDALEKWDRNLRLTQEDMQELHSRLSEHPEVDKVAGEDLNELIERHLIDSDE